MAYYIYENWTAENKAVIHWGNCGFCREGQGCHANPLGTKNGQWLGPYDSLIETQRTARTLGRPIK